MSDVSSITRLRAVPIDPGAAAILVAASRTIPISGWDFAAWPGASLGERLQANELRGLIAELRRGLDADGFAAVRLQRIFAEQPAAVAAAATMLLMTAFGAPLRVYGNNPHHWRTVGVDLEKAPYRSEGVGLLPLHMDFVNAANPPDVICLACLRPDPQGGGASLVARIGGIEELLETQAIEVLSRPVYRDGKVVDLTGVGGDINPFAVLSARDGERFRYRYVGHLVETVSDPEPRAAIHALARALASRTVEITLAAGDLLLVNQHLAVHGKLPLGPGQADLAADARRELLLSFLRTPLQP